MQCESRVGTCALDMLKGRQNSGLEPYSKAKRKKNRYVPPGWILAKAHGILKKVA